MRKFELIVTAAVIALIALIATVGFAFVPNTKEKILYPNLDTFDENHYNVLKESGREAVVVGRIKGEKRPSLWIGGNRYPITDYMTTPVFLRKKGTEPVYIMKIDGKEYVQLGNHKGPSFNDIWGGLLAFEQDRPWTDVQIGTQIGTSKVSEHEGRVVYVGVSLSPRLTYSVVVEDTIIATWTHRPLAKPRFIAVGTRKDKERRSVVAYEVISDDETSLVTVIGDQKILTPIESVR